MTYEMMPLGFLVTDSLYPATEPMVCDVCPDKRPLEILHEPPVMDKYWYVCPCCGTRSLLPAEIEE